MVITAEYALRSESDFDDLDAVETGVTVATVFADWQPPATRIDARRMRERNLFMKQGHRDAEMKGKIGLMGAMGMAL